MSLAQVGIANKDMKNRRIRKNRRRSLIQTNRQAKIFYFGGNMLSRRQPHRAAARKRVLPAARCYVSRVHVSFVKVLLQNSSATGTFLPPASISFHSFFTALLPFVGSFYDICSIGVIYFTSP